MATDRTPAATSARRAAFDPSRMVPFLPERLGGWSRTSLEPASRQDGLSTSGPVLRAEYERDRFSASLSIDAGAQRSTLAADWNGPPVDRKTDTGREAFYKKEGRVFRETFETASHESSVTCTLANGIVVVAISRSADIEALRALVNAVDLDRAGALRRRR